MKRIVKIVLFLLVVVVGYVFYYFYPQLDLISGFSAKNVASCYFLDNRNLESIEKNDNDIPKIDWASKSISKSLKSATSSVYGLKSRTAIYREGLGATLVNDNFDTSEPYLVPKRNKVDNGLVFPFGNKEPKDTIFNNIDYKKLDVAVANAFDAENIVDKRTRAIVVIYKNKIIAEKYAKGYNKNNRFLGWSMTKSITATYFGILQKQGKFDINKPAPIAEWKNDNRKNITTNNLLQMNSGLEWEEDYGKISDVTNMLFKDLDVTKSQINKPFVGKTNKNWNYSSGTTNLLSGILRSQFATHQQYLDFWYSSLIDKIGMQSMVIETDMKGNYIGSSYGWATARDWSKFGLLYLNNGNWNGEQILDKSWIKYITTPTFGSDGTYGGHFWLNVNGYYPDAPRNMYSANGYQGQRVFVLPNQDLVIVRLGLSESKKFDFNGFLKGVLGSFKK